MMKNKLKKLRKSKEEYIRRKALAKNKSKAKIMLVISNKLFYWIFY